MLLGGFDRGLAINQQVAIGQAFDEHDPIEVVPILAVDDISGNLGRVSVHDRSKLDFLAFEPSGIVPVGRLAGGGAPEAAGKLGNDQPHNLATA